MTVSAVSKYS